MVIDACQPDPSTNPPVDKNDGGGAEPGPWCSLILWDLGLGCTCRGGQLERTPIVGGGGWRGPEEEQFRTDEVLGLRLTTAAGGVSWSRQHLTIV